VAAHSVAKLMIRFTPLDVVKISLTREKVASVSFWALFAMLPKR
jgi:hypothetical protein